MDNKITRNRLSNYLSYEWIFVIIISLASLIVWELIYTVASVRLTVGQQFKYYYDQNVSGSTDSSLYDLFGYGEKDGTFSYDILSLSSESLQEDYNVLSVRLSVQEGDVIFTSTAVKEPENEDDYATSRANSLIDGLDGVGVYSADNLLNDAKTYLHRFVKDGVAETGNEMLDYENLDPQKIEEHFLERMAGDNRFRSQEEKDGGIELEKGRIKKLCEETAFFQKILEYDAVITAVNPEDSLFYRYTRYEQTYNTATNAQGAEEYKKAYEKEKEKAQAAGFADGKMRYGLKAEKLTGGDHDPSEYFKKSGASDAKDVVILVFDFLKYQPELQFESISFLNTIIRACSDLETRI